MNNSKVIVALEFFLLKNELVNEIDKYIENVEESRKNPFQQLRKIIAENLPQGFTEEMSYGLPSWIIGRLSIRLSL